MALLSEVELPRLDIQTEEMLISSDQASDRLTLNESECEAEEEEVEEKENNCKAETDEQ